MADQQSGSRKRKKRKSVLQQAKRYASKGCYGRGSDLPEDTFQYLVRVLELSKNTFETPEEKEIFVNNSFDQMEGEEIKFSSNQLGSRVIETLLPHVNNEILNRFLDAFGKDLRPLCVDRFASHVLQKLIVTAAQRGTNTNRAVTSPESESSFDQFVLKCGNFVMNNLEDFVWDTYANHVIRTCLECLGGFSEGATAEAKPFKREKPSNGEESEAECRNVPPEFKEVVKEIARRIMMWPQFVELPYSDITSGLLQTLLQVLRAVSKNATSDLLKMLLEKCFRYVEAPPQEEEEKKGDGPPLLPDVFINETASRVLDVAIAVASPKRLTQIYADCFINHLCQLSQMSIGNHQVQRLFQHCSEKTEFESMYDEISPSLEDILRVKNTGVVLSLAQACKRLATKQQYFQQELMKALHCWEPEEKQTQFALLVAKLETFEQREEDKDKTFVHIHGSLILQTLLQFNKPIKIVNSLLAANVDELIVLFSDPKGSHVMDAFMSSPSIGEKSREKMIRKLQGNLVKLACSKHGSRSLDAVWAIMNIKQKSVALEELGRREAVLNGHQFGKIVAAKYQIGLFKHRPQDWKELQGATNKKRKLFEDIIGDVGKS